MNYFESILVPVDFTINTQVAIQKAIELATPGLSVIHLFHVSSTGLLNSFNGAGTVTSLKSGARNACEEKLMLIKNEIENAIEGTKVQISVTNANNVEGSLIAFIKEMQPSLVVIAKNNHHSLFSFFRTVTSANVAEKTNCAVLTVKPGSLYQKTTTVVMPVADFFPKRKIEILSTLSAKAPLNVHLLTILNNDQHPDDHSASALLQAMRWIKSKSTCSVQHSVIHSGERAIATLRYAERINADMVLVNPATEANISSWITKKDIADILKPASTLQVLSIQPDIKR